MNNINMDELQKLSKLGASDNSEAAPMSISSAIAATVTVCTSAGWASLLSSISLSITITKHL